jgi:hypothetical protein
MADSLTIIEKALDTLAHDTPDHDTPDHEVIDENQPTLHKLDGALYSIQFIHDGKHTAAHSWHLNILYVVHEFSVRNNLWDTMLPLLHMHRYEVIRLLTHYNTDLISHAHTRLLRYFGSVRSPCCSLKCGALSLSRTRNSPDAWSITNDISFRAIPVNNAHFPAHSCQYLMP